MRSIKYLTILITLFNFECGFSQTYTPTKENLQNRKEFQDAKFGMFIHWGVYSVLGVGEWAMETESIEKSDYEKVATFFNPTEFDAVEWVLFAKSVGNEVHHRDD